MATKIVILNGNYIRLDNSYTIAWSDKGSSMPALPDTIHAVVWDGVDNEIQNKDASTGMMTGNTNLSATSDAVGSTTIAALLTWAETRKGEIEASIAAYNAAVEDDAANETNNTDGKTWRDY